MNRIKIDVSAEELDFIRDAIQRRYLDLMCHLNYCQDQHEDAGLAELMKEATDEWEAEIKGKKIIAKKAPAKSKAAPYSYKKDGTPKKRPGRKVAA